MRKRLPEVEVFLCSIESQAGEGFGSDEEDEEFGPGPLLSKGRKAAANRRGLLIWRLIR